MALSACAIACEMRPIHFRREGILLALSLPFTIGVWSICGPFMALVVEVVAVVAAALVRGERSYLSWNLPLILVANGMGGLLASTWTAGGLHWSVGAMLFFGAYLSVNAGLARLVRGSNGALVSSPSWIEAWSAWAVGTVCYFILTVSAGILARESILFLIPALLIPIEFLRDIARRQKLVDDRSHETMVALTAMLQRAHPYTHGHLERVGRLAESVGLRLGLGRARSRQLYEAAILHDIGKIAVDEAILDKPSKLTEEEFAHIKQHSAHGAEILGASERFAPMVPWIRHHHERPDGFGYPHALTDSAIPIESKIIAVSDAFDAMAGSEPRPYAPQKTESEAMMELRRCAGTQFDPLVVEAFCAAVNEEAGVA